jgi:hypothetical protein
MSKFNFAACAAFATQTAEGTYNTTLDGITTVLTAANGLVLGHAGSGVGESGIDLGLGREFSDKGLISGTLTRPISDYLRKTVPTFSFAFTFCGNRANAAATPVDANMTPIAGVNALLVSAMMVGAARSGADVGWTYLFSGSQFPISALVYIGGMRLELLDCRASSLELAYTPGQIPIATVELVVGSVKDVAVGGLPSTLTWGEQASVSAAKVETVAHTWKNARGFSELTITIEPEVTDILDSNAADGVVKEIDARTVTIEGTMFSDDAGSDEGFDSDQIQAAAEGSLYPLSFSVGDAAIGSGPVKGHIISIPLPELHESEQSKLGSKAATAVTGVARGAAAGAGNDEFSLIWI